MGDSRLPTEVELIFEVMPCNALRTAQEPGRAPHPCSYFRRWGSYHSYDYASDGPPPRRGVVHDSVYLGRGPLVPEVLSGCRKAPILAVGINPNLPGWWRWTRGSVNPLFDDYRQYAHYFRYRAISKLQVPQERYLAAGGGPHDTPFSDFELDVPADERGRWTIPLEVQPVTVYETYQALLEALAERMGWHPHRLAVGEDLAYGNMVACPSATWTTKPSPGDPTLPPMTEQERTGIVTECFHTRRYFLRQLFQSLPAVVLILSQSTANAFNAELRGRFVKGAPEPEEPLERLMKREVRFSYGELPDGSMLDARVVFSPHITGDPRHFEQARDRVVSQLAEEAQAGRVVLDQRSGHLRRPPGACVFCPMLEIGPCDYVDDLRPLSPPARLTADSPVTLLQDEKRVQAALLANVLEAAPPVERAWAGTDEPHGPEPGPPAQRPGP
jgi:hypothetical protein